MKDNSKFKDIQIVDDKGNWIYGGISLADIVEFGQNNLVWHVLVKYLEELQDVCINEFKSATDTNEILNIQGRLQGLDQALYFTSQVADDKRIQQDGIVEELEKETK